MTSRRRACVIALDGVGIGAARDADAYGDSGSNTLGHVAVAVGGAALPNLERLGLGRIAPLAGVRCDIQPAGAWGALQPAPHNVARVIARPFVGAAGAFPPNSEPPRFLDRTVWRDAAGCARGRRDCAPGRGKGG